MFRKGHDPVDNLLKSVTATDKKLRCMERLMRLRRDTLAIVSKTFLRSWKGMMGALARKHGLDTSKLDAIEVL